MDSAQRTARARRMARWTAEVHSRDWDLWMDSVQRHPPAFAPRVASTFGLAGSHAGRRGSPWSAGLPRRRPPAPEPAGSGGSLPRFGGRTARPRGLAGAHGCASEPEYRGRPSSHPGFRNPHHERADRQRRGRSRRTRPARSAPRDPGRSRAPAGTAAAQSSRGRRGPASSDALTLDSSTRRGRSRGSLLVNTRTRRAPVAAARNPWKAGGSAVISRCGGRGISTSRVRQGGESRVRKPKTWRSRSQRSVGPPQANYARYHAT
jgi:hypothetical protein